MAMGGMKWIDAMAPRTVGQTILIATISKIYMPSCRAVFVVGSPVHACMHACNVHFLHGMYAMGNGLGGGPCVLGVFHCCWLAN